MARVIAPSFKFDPYGCELVRVKTGSTVQLDTDKDLVIRKGELTVR
jgi:hypothetical protein